MLTKLKKEYLRFIRKQYFKNKDYYDKNVLLRDVFGKKRTRRVLLSTLTSSLSKEINFSHTNLLEHRIAAEIFDEFGYSVDVTNFNSSKSYFTADKYSVVYGGGASLIDSLHDKNCKSICYSPGVSSYTLKLNTYDSLIRFANTSNKYAYSSIRDAGICLDQLYFTDCIVVLGNSYTAETYVVNSNVDRKKIYELNAFYFDIVKPSFCLSKINRSRNNFIWFGSSGCVHKGLDILIEFFRQNPSLKLYICGANPREKEFFSYYKKELTNNIENIHNCGFVDLKGEIFQKLMNKCSAVLFPSASEGSAPSVLNVMANGGLIPIITRQCGIDAEKYGFVMQHPSATELNDKINKYKNLTDLELHNLATLVAEETREKYSVENYRNSLRNIIQRFLIH